MHRLSADNTRQRVKGLLSLTLFRIQRQQQLAQLQQNQVYQPMVQAGQQLPQGNQQAGNQQYQQAGNQMNQPGVNQVDQQVGNQGDQQVGNQGYQQVGNQVDQQAGDQGGQQALNPADQQAVNPADQQAGNQPDQQAGNPADQQAGNPADQQAVNQADQQAGNQAGQQEGEQVNQIPQPHQDQDGNVDSNRLSKKERRGKERLPAHAPGDKSERGLRAEHVVGKQIGEGAGKLGHLVDHLKDDTLHNAEHDLRDENKGIDDTGDRNLPVLPKPGNDNARPIAFVTGTALHAFEFCFYL